MYEQTLVCIGHFLEAQVLIHSHVHVKWTIVTLSVILPLLYLPSVRSYIGTF